MKISKKALNLLKKFAAGAPCEVDFSNIQGTMFWFWLNEIAKKQGLFEISTETVKRYWFAVHNNLVKQRYDIGLGFIKKEEAENCMVSVENYQGEQYCFHGGKPVCPITSAEAKTIKDKTPKL
ncbi:hypothetical protein KKF60_02645 [Patescibacteria group bacterium]|nr:hypothetical protein [Patescibacteria group bacterium]MBU4458768.1 hypothetical protein [Patescibacteria group bacterium]MCG2696069.1 hypothetical protein [Candidatus Portnoybacteria bacterium]